MFRRISSWSRRRDVDVSHHDELGDIRKSCVSRVALVVLGDRQPVAVLGDLAPIGLHVDRHGPRVPDRNRSHFRGARLQQVGFVGQADADERAPWALGTVFQRRWNLAPIDNIPQSPEGLHRERSQLLVERDPHTLPRAREVQVSLATRVAMLFKQ